MGIVIRDCACGCGRQFLVGRIWWRKYLNTKHAKRDRNARYLDKTDPKRSRDGAYKRLCACGCGEWFYAKRATTKFLSPKHRESFHNLKRAQHGKDHEYHKTCSCGCGTRFTTNNYYRRYLTSKHRRDAETERRRQKNKQAKVMS